MAGGEARTLPQSGLLEHGVSATVALRLLFEGNLPEFVDLN